MKPKSNYTNSPQTNESGFRNIFLKVWNNIKNLDKVEWASIGYFILAGGIMISFGLYLEEREIHFISKLLLIIGGMLIYRGAAGIIDKSALQKRYVGIIKEVVDEKIKKGNEELLQRIHEELEGTKEAIVDSVTKRLVKIKHVYDAGIVDAFEGLDLARILKKSKDTEIIIQRLYFSREEFTLLKESIHNLIIEHNCKFRILLLSPNRKDIIEERVKNSLIYEKRIGYRVDDICVDSISHIDEFQKIINKLPENKKKYLQVRVYSCHPAASITGYGDVIITGLYLNDEFADKGFQVKRKGENKRSYQQLYQQYNSTWTKATVYISGKIINRKTGTGLK